MGLRGNIVLEPYRVIVVEDDHDVAMRAKTVLMMTTHASLTDVKLEMLAAHVSDGGRDAAPLT